MYGNLYTDIKQNLKYAQQCSHGEIVFISYLKFTQRDFDIF